MSLTADQVESIAVKAATTAAQRTVEAAATRAAERASLSAQDVSSLVAQAVRQTLIQLGVDAQNPLEMQRDFQYLRQWRKAQAELKTKGLLALLGIVLSGFIGLLLLGIRDWFRG